jgi:hypothetical protein
MAAVTVEQVRKEAAFLAAAARILATTLPAKSFSRGVFEGSATTAEGIVDLIDGNLESQKGEKKDGTGPESGTAAGDAAPAEAPRPVAD